MDDKQLLDLDAIAPQQRQIKINGQTYALEPPKLKTLPEFARIMRSLAKLAEEDDETKILEAMAKFRELIKSVVPDLPDDIDFTMGQSSALITMIMEMVTPAETKALAKEGLTPSTQKKTDTVS